MELGKRRHLGRQLSKKQVDFGLATLVWLGVGARSVVAPCQADPIPYTQLHPSTPGDVKPAPPPPEPQVGGTDTIQPPEPLPPETMLPDTAQPPPLLVPQSQGALLRDALRAARSGDAQTVRALNERLQDPIARKIALWQLIDSAPTRLDFTSLNGALHDLEGWPRGWRRIFGAEKTIEAASLSPQSVMDWFAGRDPDTVEGAMALAAAYQSLGHADEAKDLIRHYWREHIFEVEAQNRLLSRFGGFLSAEDHAARLETLLYAQQGPATRAMMELTDADHRTLAEARIALRGERNDAPELVMRVSHDLSLDPGLAFDRARYYRRKNLTALAAEMLKNFPADTPDKADVADFIWSERRALMLSLIRAGDTEGAYAAATDTGLKAGPALVEAEFYAGWLALERMNNPVLADKHFATLLGVAQSAIGLGRGYYWRGRAATARGDNAAANAFYTKGSAYLTTFYGLLCAEAAGRTDVALGKDPEPTAVERKMFEGRDLTQALHRLAEIGEREAFRSIALAEADLVTSPGELALLVDLARQKGDQELALRVARAGNTHGLILPERAYPVRDTPQPPGAAEPAFMLAITRQESSFEPRARSSVGARGLMQLMPATAQGLARHLNLHYSPLLLDEPDYNMRLGGVYLGSLVTRFGGSYIMAAAAYNAGPGRPADWINGCGDPRGGAIDPLDFIECIPFTETRAYVMRVMENTAVYRARLHGGTAPLTIAEDLKRGAPVQAPTSIDSLLQSLGGAH